MVRVARPDVFRQRFGAAGPRLQIFLLAGHLVEEHVPDPQLANLVGFNSTVKLMRHVLNAPAVFGLIVAVCGEGDIRPVPVCGRGAVRKLVVQHAANHGFGLFVARVGIPGDQRIHHRPKEHCGIVLPVGALERLAVKYRVDQVDFQPGSRVGGHLVLQKIPAQVQNSVVAKILIRMVPG